jgi:hypothetical protein
MIRNPWRALLSLSLVATAPIAAAISSAMIASRNNAFPAATAHRGPGRGLARI